MPNKGPIVSVSITPEPIPVPEPKPWYVIILQAIIDFFRWLFGRKG